MEKTRNKDLWGLAIGVVILSAIATVVGAVVVARGSGLVYGAFVGACSAVFLLVGVFAVYRLWARVAWGAPFTVGDNVRIVRGTYAGQRAVVTALGQGLEVTLLVESDGSALKDMPWRAVRRESPRASL